MPSLVHTAGVPEGGLQELLLLGGVGGVTPFCEVAFEGEAVPWVVASVTIPKPPEVWVVSSGVIALGFGTVVAVGAGVLGVRLITIGAVVAAQAQLAQVGASRRAFAALA